MSKWKTIGTNSLDLGNTRALTRDERAEALSKLMVTAQLKSYVLSLEVRELVRNRKFHAHLVLIVGSRKILVWEMDEKGDWIGQPGLA
ncbi:hypothetical protein HOY80DRAFT_1032179 [Tuber brumale]|nr:hypothetical protein HOY80DRAFT_1032179 [Tuber brumale]